MNIQVKLFSVLSFIALCITLNSCQLLYPFEGNTSGGTTTTGDGTIGGMVARQGNYTVKLVQCTGSRSNQAIEIVLMVTNSGVNESMYLGSDAMAIDNYGNTLHSGYSTKYEFPTGVSVKVTVSHIKLVEPRTTMLSFFKLPLGSGKVVEFRNVPVQWTN